MADRATWLRQKWSYPVGQLHILATYPLFWLESEDDEREKRRGEGRESESKREERGEERGERRGDKSTQNVNELNLQLKTALDQKKKKETRTHSQHTMEDIQ